MAALVDAAEGAIDVESGNVFLTDREFPEGLQRSMLRRLAQCPKRFIIMDDSGTMLKGDGHQMVKVVDHAVIGHIGEFVDKRIVPCSRWTEMVETVRFQAGLAHACKAPSEFRFLNAGRPFIIGASDGTSDKNLGMLLNHVGDDGPGPSGATPLCRHIAAVIESIKAMEAGLREMMQKVVIIIQTDGAATDGDLKEAMAPLHDLPVWIVLRLCTDEAEVVNYWNTLDKELELNMDILNDFESEAREINEKNPWLTYGLPLHQMREFGINVREVDLLDEETLTPEQVQAICFTIFGGTRQDWPHPQSDTPEFLKKVKAACAATGKTFNPIRKCSRPWVEVDELKAVTKA